MRVPAAPSSSTNCPNRTHEHVDRLKPSAWGGDGRQLHVEPVGFFGSLIVTCGQGNQAAAVCSIRNVQPFTLLLGGHQQL